MYTNYKYVHLSKWAQFHNIITRLVDTLTIIYLILLIYIYLNDPITFLRIKV